MNPLTASQLRKRYLDFFKNKGHAVIPSAPLVPENDPTVLYVVAGMQPLVPFLLGQPHPQGQRLANVQKCVRTIDIDQVGDSSHLTFFEMLGNWSLGDYFKKEAIAWSFEFLTEELAIPVERLSVTCFAGDKGAPKDEEAAEIWEKVGINRSHIYFLSREHNWWGPAGQIGPCGPSSEMFVDTGKKACGPDCDPSCSCGKYLEIWNDVFLSYNRTVEGRYELLDRKNIDTGMGLERTLVILNGLDDVFGTELFIPLIRMIEELSGREYLSDPETTRAMRIIADHIRSAVFILADGVTPSNTEQGYVLRRLVRRAVRYGSSLGIEGRFLPRLADIIVGQQSYRIGTIDHIYPELGSNCNLIKTELSLEEEAFAKTLKRGLREFEKLVTKGGGLTGKDAFYLYETYGFPWELTREEARRLGIELDQAEFERAKKQHQEQSRAGAREKFAGGLADHSVITTKYHTATHLLQAALRQVLGDHVQQKGSNITHQRLRFDFTHDSKLTEKEISQVEETVNQAIRDKLPVTAEQMSLQEAKNGGALAFFAEKYGDKVTVYTIGDSDQPFSREVCGGPHVSNTGELGRFKIIKQEAIGRGQRRIKARLL